MPSASILRITVAAGTAGGGYGTLGGSALLAVGVSAPDAGGAGERRFNISIVHGAQAID